MLAHMLQHLGHSLDMFMRLTVHGWAWLVWLSEMLLCVLWLLSMLLWVWCQDVALGWPGCLCRPFLAVRCVCIQLLCTWISL